MGTSTSKVVKLTERSIEKLPSAAPGDKLLLLDKQQTGFGISITASKQSYFVARRVNRKPVRFVFRRVGEGTLAEARKAAERLLVEMGEGKNPVATKRAAAVAAAQKKSQGTTLRDAWTLRKNYLTNKGRSIRTIETEEYLLTKYLAAWMDRELVSFTPEEVNRKHTALAAAIAHGRYKRDAYRPRAPGSGRATANNVFHVFRACWNRAAAQNKALGDSPTDNIDWFEIEARQSPIRTAGLAELFARIQKIERADRRDIWTLMLYTGLRLTSACEVRWADVNLDKHTLHIPTPKGGRKRAFTIPLPRVMVEMFQRRKAAHEELCGGVKKMLPWVFPAPDSESGRIVEVRVEREVVTVDPATGRKSKTTINAIGIKPHDARRLFTTVAEGSDISWSALKFLTNHKLPKNDQTGEYIDKDPEQLAERLRAPMEKIAARMTELCTPKPAPDPKAAANVVSISKGKRKAA